MAESNIDDLFSCEDEELEAQSQTNITTTPTYSSNDDLVGQGGQYLIKLETEGDYPILYLLVHDRPDVYYIEATDGQMTWAGAYSHQTTKEVAKSAKMPERDVVMETRQALTGESQTSSKYLYTTSRNTTDNSLEFVWKKHLIADNIKFTLGTIVMETQISNVLHAKMMDHAVSKIYELRAVIHDLNLEKERLLSERSAALKRLEKCIDLKDEVESDLYGKFKVVLNEKKSKIRRLMDSLNYVSTQQQEATGKRKNGELERQTSPTRREDSSDEDAENLEEKTPSPKAKETAGSKFPGESLLKDDWQTETTSPPVKRRKRERKKCTTGIILLNDILVGNLE